MTERPHPSGCGLSVMPLGGRTFASADGTGVRAAPAGACFESPACPAGGRRYSRNAPKAAGPSFRVVSHCHWVYESQAN
ncbi:hypothetical protein ACPXCX_53270, partial [Streptomyces sp. DT225]